MQAERDSAKPLSPDQALERLLSGNYRYISPKSDGDKTAQRREELALVQNPIAVVIGCSDSRVPPEMVLDQSLGDLFVVRVAGNVVDGAVMGSVEYAVEQLKVPLILVLGHERCAAVQAAIKEHRGRHVNSVLDAIRPAVTKAKKQDGDLLDNAVKANVQQVVAHLKADPELAAAVKAGKLKIAGARYDLDTGVVDVIA